MSVELPVRIHATTIALAGAAAVIRGASGAGKSDLALRCLMMAPNALVSCRAELVSDDYTELFLQDDAVFARPPAEIANLLEVRGLGIVEIEAVASARVALFVDLAEASSIERLPGQETQVDVVGRTFPALRLCAAESSAAAKLLLALDFVSRHGRLPTID
ncbi:MAG: aldolase [Alphaproteobacteria bacterium]|nr:aldolase [Alphaproteobacteria bacterium]